MALLIYSKNTRGAGERLLSAISLLLPEDKFDICRSIGELSKRLRQPAFKPNVAVLLTSSREELQKILSIRELLEDTKIILIVPDTNPETIREGHMLRPRFLCDCDSNFVAVVAVLGLMLRNMGYLIEGIHP
jgi:hypothetical protein